MGQLRYWVMHRVSGINERVAGYPDHRSAHLHRCLLAEIGETVWVAWY